VSGEARTRFGIVLPTLAGDAGRVLDLASRAEDLGYDAVFVPDHLGAGGAMPLEAGTTLAAVAAATRSIAVGALVLRTSLRPVGMLAKLIATLDDVADGRCIVGLGAGDAASAAEQAALGLPSLDTEARRRHLAETIAALRALLAGDAWAGGDRVGPIAGPILPRPSRVPPIWVGGASDAVAAIAVERADAWNGWGMETERFATVARRVVAGGAAATWGGIVAVGRTDDEVTELLGRRRAAGLPAPHWSGTTEAFAGWVEGLRAIPVSWFTMVVAGGGPAIELLAREALPGVRGDA
jgi:alkanesulfonate monooxygenase SsuD/methylene tetrahydromethanopterin reductase-like flavin-dependent oxidoreductase (luciferase family)